MPTETRANSALNEAQLKFAGAIEVLFMQILGATKFDQCVINLALIHLCNQSSYVGESMRSRYSESEDATINPWLDLHQFTIFVPHPDQQYENITLEEGLTQGFNVESKPIERTQVPYDIPAGGHFVVVLKQQGLDLEFAIAATGVFIRPLAALSLDIIVDLETAEYQPLVIHHPVIRDYPSGWEEKLKLFMQKEMRWEELPNVVGYVDQATNSDYRSPSWSEIYLTKQGFAL